MTEKERVTVDFDSECYYLDGEFWTSWDNYGEEMADSINNLLNKQDERIQELENELNGIYKSYSDYYGMSIRNAEWYGFEGDVE